MTDWYLKADGDLVLTDTGDILLAEGWDEVEQRIIRIAVTNPLTRSVTGRLTAPEYPYDPKYGLGLPAKIGEVITDEDLAIVDSIVRDAILGDIDVDKSIEPTIIVTAFKDNVIQIDAEFRLVTEDKPRKLTFAL